MVGKAMILTTSRGQGQDTSRWRARPRAHKVDIHRTTITRTRATTLKVCTILIKDRWQDPTPTPSSTLPTTNSKWVAQACTNKVTPTPWVLPRLQVHTMAPVHLPSTISSPRTCNPCSKPKRLTQGTSKQVTSSSSSRDPANLSPCFSDSKW